METEYLKKRFEKELCELQQRHIEDKKELTENYNNIVDEFVFN